MAKPDLSIRSVPRFEGIAKSKLKKGEIVEAALPVWLGGTYLPFFASIVVGVAAGSVVSSGFGNGGILYAIGGAAVGAFVGNFLAKRKARDHPVEASRLQVYLAVTGRRILVHENGSMGRPGGLRSELDRKSLESATVKKGGFFRPTRLALTIEGTEYVYEYSGLWRVPGILDELGAEPA